MTLLNQNRNAFFLLFIWMLISQASRSQNTQLLGNAYAHNDYWNKRPLFDALDNGFTYIEADVYLRHENLVVAHVLPSLQPSRTLNKLYLEPLADFFKNDSMGTSHPLVTLMIDIKSEPEKAYRSLAALLQNYRSFLSRYENGVVYMRAITIVITGKKPVKTIKDLGSRCVFMDEDLINMEKDRAPANLFPMASCRYSNIVSVNKRGTITPEEKQRLCNYIRLAHEQGKKVRLWASPENTTIWKELLSCGVDLINTNKLAKLRDFLLSNYSGITKAGH